MQAVSVFGGVFFSEGQELQHKLSDVTADRFVSSPDETWHFCLLSLIKIPPLCGSTKGKTWIDGKSWITIVGQNIMIYAWCGEKGDFTYSRL